MSPLDALWHLLNFLAPAVFMALFSTAASKLIWSRSLRAKAWRKLLLWALLPAIGVAIGGLVLTGRDGAMATYAAMVAAVALGLWIGGFLGKAG